MSDGWIKLHRKILDAVEWETLSPLQLKAMFGLMLQVNHEARRYRCPKCKTQIRIKRGATVKSIRTLANHADVSKSVMEDALNNLLETGFISADSRAKCHRVVIINNWDFYQLDDRQQSGQQSRQQSRQREDSERTARVHNKNDKNDKNDKKSNASRSPSPSQLKKDQLSKDANSVLQAYYDSFKAEYGIAPVINFNGSDRTTALKLIESVGVEKAKAIATAYPQHKDGRKWAFICSNATDMLLDIENVSPRDRNICSNDDDDFGIETI